MLIVPQLIEIKATGKNKEYYQTLGYALNKNVFIVKIEDLLLGSHSKIKLLCDECLKKGIETQIEKIYKNYNTQKKKNNNHIDTCKKCTQEKRKKTNQQKYGVDFPTQLEETNEKRKQTNMRKYGSKSPLGNKEILNKAKETSLKKYGKEFYMQTEEYINRIKEKNNEVHGVDFLFQSKEFKEKMKNKNLEKYGVIYTSQRQDIQEKIKSSNLKKYGYEHLMKNPLYAKQINKKIRESMFKNNSSPSSCQQKFICSILNGNLNWLEDNLFLDIAFPEQKIYVEYDGSGHDLIVQLKKQSMEEFKSKEINRQYFLKERGWKLIRIISKKDWIPSEEKIKEIFTVGLDVISCGRSWVVFNIDEGTIESKENKGNFDFGVLSRVKNEKNSLSD